MFAWESREAWGVLICAGIGVALLAIDWARHEPSAVAVTYPLDRALFPPEIVPPIFRWKDQNQAVGQWQVRVFSDSDSPDLVAMTTSPNWTPSSQQWALVKRQSVENEATVVIRGVDAADPETVLFDLYRIPFNDGKGGRPEPLKGASHNGMSNYFAKYSPDGTWIVFCKARKACELTRYAEPVSLYLLSAAEAEVGRFQEATSLATQALSAVRSSSHGALTKRIETALRL